MTETDEAAKYYWTLLAAGAPDSMARRIAGYTPTGGSEGRAGAEPRTAADDAPGASQDERAGGGSDGWS